MTKTSFPAALVGAACRLRRRRRARSRSSSSTTTSTATRHDRALPVLDDEWTRTQPIGADCLGDVLRRPGRADGAVQPDPVPQVDAVDAEPRRVAGGGGEGVPFDGAQSEALA